MKLNYNNTIIDVEVIGGFKINEHEYSVCSYEDEFNKYKIVIVEIQREGEDIKVKDIPEEEMELVMSTYKEIESKLLEGEDNE